MPFSQYLAEASLNWFRNAAYPAQPANVYVSLHSANPGVAGLTADVTTTVAPSRATLAATNISAPTASALPDGGFESSNTVQVLFTNNALGAANLNYFGLWSAVSGGNFLGHGLISNPVAVLAGDIVSFSPGQLVIRVI